ncbi:MAG: tyrosine-type recombinase/integrase [Dehalococcoidia bacterium]|nr:tyrosine-type recombinase/integrase [Dehalococcoidia bacterium]
MATLSDGLRIYRVLARAENRSPRTVDWITSSVRYFMEFLGGDPDLDTISANDLRNFVLALQQTRSYRQHPFRRPLDTLLSQATIQNYARGVRAVFGHLHRDGYIPTNPMERVRMPRVDEKTIRSLSDKQVEHLLSQADQKTDLGFRDYTIMLTFVDTGIRVGELVKLAESDVDLESGFLKVIGKTRRERLVPFGKRLTKALLKYQNRHRPDPLGNDHFFLTLEGRPLNENRVERIVRGYGVKAGIRVWPHLLRHTFALLYIRNGGDPVTLQKILGHRTLAMTIRYLNMIGADLKAAHDRFSPGDRLRL